MIDTYLSKVSSIIDKVNELTAEFPNLDQNILETSYYTKYLMAVASFQNILYGLIFMIKTVHREQSA